jgi:hypothetical protein
MKRKTNGALNKMDLILNFYENSTLFIKYPNFLVCTTIRQGFLLNFFDNDFIF